MPSEKQTFSDDFRRRFSGIARLYGEQGLIKIKNANILVIGIGGVGSWVAEALARTGLSTIALMDMDEVCLSNVNRQIHALTDNVGQSKIAVMGERLKQINPDINIDLIEDFLDKENIQQYLHQQYDFVVDAIDSVISKAALIAHCKRHKIPILTIGGAGGQRDPGKIKIRDLAKTTGDPLLAKVRNELRRHYRFSRNVKRPFDIKAIYSDEQLYYPQGDGSVLKSRPEQMDSSKMDCQNGFGAASFVTASFANMAVSFILEKITAKNPSHKLRLD